MKLSKIAIKRLILLLLAIACLVPAMPAAADSELSTRVQTKAPGIGAEGLRNPAPIRPSIPSQSSCT